MTFSLYQYQIFLIAYLKFLLMVYGQIKNVSFFVNIWNCFFVWSLYFSQNFEIPIFHIFKSYCVTMCTATTTACHLFGTVRFSTTKGFKDSLPSFCSTIQGEILYFIICRVDMKVEIWNQGVTPPVLHIYLSTPGFHNKCIYILLFTSQ